MLRRCVGSSHGVRRSEHFFSMNYRCEFSCIYESETFSGASVKVPIRFITVNVRSKEAGANDYGAFRGRKDLLNRRLFVLEKEERTCERQTMDTQ